MSLLQATGHGIDLLGSMVRDTLSARNPFDQILSPFSGENRTTGEQLIGDYTGSHGHHVLGALAEMLLDPTALVGGWATRGALKSAGVTAKGVGKAIRGGVQGAKDAYGAAKNVAGAVRKSPYNLLEASDIARTGSRWKSVPHRKTIDLTNEILDAQRELETATAAHNAAKASYSEFKNNYKTLPPIAEFPKFESRLDDLAGAVHSGASKVEDLENYIGAQRTRLGSMPPPWESKKVSPYTIPWSVNSAIDVASKLPSKIHEHTTTSGILQGPQLIAALSGAPAAAYNAMKSPAAKYAGLAAAMGLAPLARSAAPDTEEAEAPAVEGVIPHGASFSMTGTNQMGHPMPLPDWAKKYRYSMAGSR